MYHPCCFEGLLVMHLLSHTVTYIIPALQTIGDSYVAVAGLPEPRNDHAVVMAKFAKDCREKFMDLTQQLEVTLGPETGDLGIRIGLHSGPVTAGKGYLFSLKFCVFVKNLKKVFHIV